MVDNAPETAQRPAAHQAPGSATQAIRGRPDAAAGTTTSFAVSAVSGRSRLASQPPSTLPTGSAAIRTPTPIDVRPTAFAYGAAKPSGTTKNPTIAASM